MPTDLISYKCFNCETEQLDQDPFLEDQNFEEWFFRCRCPNCNFKNIVRVYKPLQMQIQFPPFKLN